MKKRSFSRLLALALAATLWLAPAAQALTPEQAAELLETLYIDQIPQYVLDQPTVAEMVAALGDPYTEYFTPESYQAFLGSMSDTSLIGIGVVFTNSALPIPQSGLVIDQVLEGYPADLGGLLAGDAILSVDGQSVIGEYITSITGWVRGEEGTQVELTYLRDGQEHTVTLTRTSVVVASTTTQLLNGHIGYIDCSTFGAETVGHFKEGLEKYGDQADLWIVDLRSNLGGAADAAANAAGLFAGKGYMTILRNGSDQYSAIYSQEDQALLAPVIVLVDQNSASSSELFAAAIQSYRAGIVIGTRTFGKGVAQIVCDQTSLPEYFPDGDAIKITSYRFYSPDGNTTDQIGVIPELLVPAQYTMDIASLFRASPQKDHENLRIGLKWRWYIDLEEATSEENRDAFQALLDAIPQGVDLYLGSDESDRWGQLSKKDLCDIYDMGYDPADFDDLDQSDHPQVLSILKSYGLIHGVEGGSAFAPQATLTRAELCQLLYSALNCRLPRQSCPYDDVPADAWYADAVTALTNMGLVAGTGEGHFSPELPVDHQQLITIMGRLGSFLNTGFYDAALTMPQDLLQDEALTGYAEWARQSVWLLAGSRTDLLGRPVSLLWAPLDEIDPTSPTTRDEAAVLLYDLLRFTELLAV